MKIAITILLVIMIFVLGGCSEYREYQSLTAKEKIDKYGYPGERYHVVEGSSGLTAPSDWTMVARSYYETIYMTPNGDFKAVYFYADGTVRRIESKSSYTIKDEYKPSGIPGTVGY